MALPYLIGQVKDSGVALAVLLVSLGVRRWMLRRLEGVARENPKSFAGTLREGLGTPSLLWCLVLTVDALLGALDLSPKAERVGHVLVVSFLILSLTMVASTIVTRTLQKYGELHQLPFAVAGLSRTLTQVIVFSLGLVIFLSYLGISPTPLITAFGVGGLAVALALQDTLANIFAGVHILIERPIAVGDFVRLSAEEEGTVSDIGWRTTRLLTGANSTVVIPNKTITSGNLLNYSMPNLEVGAWVPVLLAHDADVEKAERIALAAALATEGVLAEPAPSFTVDPGMTPTHLQYRLSFRVPRQIQAGIIKTQILRRVLEGFRAEGVPLPEIRQR
jgi:small-conductance mechanosensitive channel